MSLAMSNDEIVMRYRQAKDRTEQVKILADLNNCPVEQIIGILTAAGIDHRCFSGLRRKMNEEAVSEAEKVVSKIPYKNPEIIPAPPEKKESAAPKAVIAAVEDKIIELRYMIEKNAEQAKGLLEHNKKFSARIDVLTAWLEEVSKNESIKN